MSNSNGEKYYNLFKMLRNTLAYEGHENNQLV